MVENGKATDSGDISPLPAIPAEAAPKTEPTDDLPDDAGSDFGRLTGVESSASEATKLVPDEDGTIQPPDLEDLIGYVSRRHSRFA
jgi:hypothetical protein